MNDDDYMSYCFEQAGKQKSISEAGEWLAAAPKSDIDKVLKMNPEVAKLWDEKVGDRMNKIVFIGKDMNKEEIISSLDECLAEF